MVSVISKNISVFSAKQFVESVSEEANTKLYLTYGRPLAWSNDASPAQANSSVTSFYEVWNNMIGGKRITGNDVRLVAPRYDWSANTVYPAYDHCTCSLLLFAANVKFYVLTSDWNVYKCIANNYGAPSTTKPTSVQVNDTFQTEDGYIWKYMYTVSASDRLRFTTADYIPVRKLTLDDNTLQWDVQQGAVPGALNYIKVTNGGSNYSNANAISIAITGDGTSAANAYATINVSTNTISAIVVDDVGRDYTYATATITAGVGSGAVLRPIISPPGGHGSNPETELGASNVMINVRIKGSEGDKLPTTNDFRQIALIQDPYLLSTNTVTSNTVFSQTVKMNVNGSSTNFVEDETVFQGTSLETATFSATVVKWDAPNLLLELTNVAGNPTTDLLKGVSSRASWYVNTIRFEDFEPNSGQLLYIDNIKPIIKSNDQTEDFKIVLKF